MDELKRIQTFPDSFVFPVGYTEAVRQLGNAVPSLMGEVLGREVRRQLLGDRVEGGLRLLPRRRGPPPPPEQPQPVPSRFLVHVGEHAPHPGTRRGSRQPVAA